MINNNGLSLTYGNKAFSAVLTFVTVVMNAPQTNIIGLRNALKLTEKKVNTSDLWHKFKYIPETVTHKHKYKWINELEGHSVERMYLQQRCFDGSVNKTIFKKVSPQQWVANTYTWDFPYVKFRIAALIRYWRKQYGSGIWTMIRTGLKS